MSRSGGCRALSQEPGSRSVHRPGPDPPVPVSVPDNVRGPPRWRLATLPKPTASHTWPKACAQPGEEWAGTTWL